MPNTVQLTRYDAATKRYVARLTVESTDGTERSYTCDGIWSDGSEQMIAGALYDQHKAFVTKQAAETAERQAIEAKIAAEITKLDSAKVEES